MLFRSVSQSRYGPTTYEFTPKSRKVASTLQNLSELKCLMDIFIQALHQGTLNIEDTVVSKIATDVVFDYFHSKPDAQREIALTIDLPKADSSLVSYDHKRYGEGLEFPESGGFFRGCVRIMGSHWANPVPTRPT